MADVTISDLIRGTPAGNHLLPYSTGNNTLAAFVSSLPVDYSSIVNKPSANFKATITSGTISNGQTVLWNSVEYQTPDNSFNTSTGEWTVPQTGRYLVCIGLISLRNTSAGDWYVDLYVGNSTIPNGGRFYTSKAGNANVHAQVNGSGIFKLNAGERIKTVLTSDVGNVATSVLHNLFCAELLG